MHSQLFIDTRSGALVTQVPLSEIGHFEEYTDTLSNTLKKLGYSHKRHGDSYAHEIINFKGEIVTIGSAASVWDWIYEEVLA